MSENKAATSSWRLVGNGISVSYSFSPDKGVCMDEFTGTDTVSGTDEICYCRGGTSLIPIVNTDEHIENGRPPFMWQLVSERLFDSVYNKRPVRQLDIVIEAVLYRLYFHAVVFPGVPVVRQWWEVENSSVSRTNGFTVKPFNADFVIKNFKDSYWLSSFGGGNARPTQGEKRSGMIAFRHDYEIIGHQTCEYTPIITVSREEEPRDGFMCALDYLGDWSFKLSGGLDGYTFGFETDGGHQIDMPPKEILPLPAVTLCCYRGGDDSLGRHIYDWQYNYMFDMTSDRYYAATKGFSHWYCEDKVLHEQFAHRAAGFDLQMIGETQSVGGKSFWSDAGWYASQKQAPGYIFLNSLNGPDFRASMKYADKCGIGYTLWFAGKPLDGVLESKAGWWGDFEWRTDAFNVRDQRAFNSAKKKIESYLGKSARRSFHSCNGGGNYCHCFDIQRLTSFNYVSDLSSSPYINYFLSYFELPDKQCECMDVFGDNVIKNNGASTLTGAVTVGWGTGAVEERYLYSRLSLIPSAVIGNADWMPSRNYDLGRYIYAIYEYMLREGVAGRYSYILHPRVWGDREYYFRIRASHDLKKAVLVISRAVPSRTVVFPDGLLPDESYEVSFHPDGKVFTATGRELSEKGITLEPQVCPGLIWFNLSDHPFGKHNALPALPKSVAVRRECNIETPGVGIYIGAGDDSARYYFSVRRDGREIGRVARGYFFFDYSADADIGCSYSVAAVGFDGRETEYVSASRLPDGEMFVSSVGSFSAKCDSFGGFSYECSDGLDNWSAMTRIPCPGDPSGDKGGTPNRPGGVEGLFEASGSSRIGRGWHQVGSKTTARVFTVPEDGEYRVTGAAMRDYFTDGSSVPVKLCILRGNEAVWNTRISAGDARPHTHDLTLTLRKGEKLRFAVMKAKAPRETVYQYEPDAVVIGWLPRIVSVSAPAFASGITRFTADGCGGLPLPKAVNGRIHFDLDAIGLSKAVFIFDSSDAYIDEGCVSLIINGRTLLRETDIVREKMSVNGPCTECFGIILPESNKISVDVSLSGGSKLLYAAFAPENGFSSFNLLGAEKYIGFDGRVWNRTVISGGRNVKTSVMPEQALPTQYDAPLYSFAHVGKDFSVTLPAPDGIYTLRILTANTLEFEGRRPVFDILVNGSVACADFDVNAFCNGQPIAACLRFENVSAVNGAVTVRFRACGKAPAAAVAVVLD